MLIKQISFNGSKIKVRYSHDAGEYAFESEEQARPEFYEAFSALTNVFAEISEINKQVKANVRSIHVETVKDELISVQVNASVTLADTPGNLTISTPTKKVPAQSETELGQVRNKALSSGSVKIVMRVIEEAAKYVDGDRAQQKLFPEKKKKDLKGDHKKLEVPKNEKASVTDIRKKKNPITGSK